MQIKNFPPILIKIVNTNYIQSCHMLLCIGTPITCYRINCINIRDNHIPDVNGHGDLTVNLKVMIVLLFFPPSEWSWLSLFRVVP